MPVVGEVWQDDTFSDQDLAGVVFYRCEFANLRLQRMDFSKCIFSDCRFDTCEFLDCKLQQMQVAGATGAGLALVGGVVEECVITQAELARLEVRQSARQLVVAESDVAVLSFLDSGLEQNQITLSGCTLGRLEALGARWRDGMAVELDLSVCEFGEGEFDRVGLIRVLATGVDLSALSFRACNLYQSELVGARLRSAESSVFAECALADADLRGAALDGALFAKAKADRACFDGASLKGALFPEATLVGASFVGASAVASIFDHADLTDANLADLDANGASFRHARLDGANVDGASFVSAQLHGVESSLDGADLRDAQGTVEWRAEREREALSSAI